MTFDGMDDSLYMPRRNIVVDGIVAPDDIDNIRPGSNDPYIVDKDEVNITLWTMPAIRYESVRLTTSTNVEDFSVSYIGPDSNDAIVVTDVSHDVYSFNANYFNSESVDNRAVKNILYELVISNYINV